MSDTAGVVFSHTDEGLMVTVEQTTMRAHYVVSVSVMAAGPFQIARCHSCGWTGPARVGSSQARVDLLQHLDVDHD